MGKESDLYNPYNTKTLGGTNKLDVETYENVQNNIHLEKANRKLMELTDLIGRVTNTRSSSGPIEVKRASVVIPGSEDSGVEFFRPDPGQIWQLCWGRWTGDGSSNNLYQADVTSGETDQIFFSSATGGAFCTDSSAEIAGGARIMITYNQYLKAQTYNDTNGSTWIGYFARLR